jgi:hypothetical protein
MDGLVRGGLMGTMDPIEVVFGHLDQSRHLPSDPLERRADGFFSVCLKDAVEALTGVSLEDERTVQRTPTDRDRRKLLLAPDAAVFASNRVCLRAR